MPTETHTENEISYLDAISAALRDEMRRDRRVFVMGQDVAELGGAFKATAGLLEEFGADRVINTPIAESATIGIATGAACLDRRPVVEMQFADFVTCGFNQVVNVAAKLYYRMERPVPMVVRLPSGGGVGAGMFHSQMVEGWFLQVPGLKVVAPAWPADAYHLLKAAIRDPNPVLYVEHKYLYRRVKQAFAVGRDDSPDRVLPQARVVRSGRDVTVATYSWMVHQSLKAAEEVAGEGISVEVIDLRVLSPLDRDTILDSVRKCGKVLIVHEGPLTGGFGGEIAALLSEHAFDYLDGPIRRLACPDTPVPFHKKLEAASLPDAAKIAKVLRQLKQW